MEHNTVKIKTNYTAFIMVGKMIKPLISLVFMKYQRHKYLHLRFDFFIKSVILLLKMRPDPKRKGRQE
jgi:hypothetical protein